ncbi:MAG: hypothetical protein ACI9AP_000754, partial [Flavobacteriales bacterium]
MFQINHIKSCCCLSTELCPKGIKIDHSSQQSIDR